MFCVHLHAYDSLVHTCVSCLRSTEACEFMEFMEWSFQLFVGLPEETHAEALPDYWNVVLCLLVGFEYAVPAFFISDSVNQIELCGNCLAGSPQRTLLSANDTICVQTASQLWSCRRWKQQFTVTKLILLEWSLWAAVIIHKQEARLVPIIEANANWSVHNVWIPVIGNTEEQSKIVDFNRYCLSCIARK